MDDGTVDIADVYADAYRVRAGDVVSGMYVFDVFGGRHRVRSVSAPRGTFHVTITREDGWQSTHGAEDTITVSNYASGRTER